MTPSNAKTIAIVAIAAVGITARCISILRGNYVDPALQQRVREAQRARANEAARRAQAQQNRTNFNNAQEASRQAHEQAVRMHNQQFDQF